MINGTRGDILLAAAYILAGVAATNLFLPKDGRMAQQLTKPYGATVRHVLRAAAGIVALPTVFIIECLANGGRPPDNGWTAELLTWAGRAPLRQSLLLVVGIAAWPIVLVEEWTTWALRPRSRT